MVQKSGLDKFKEEKCLLGTLKHKDITFDQEMTGPQVVKRMRQFPGAHHDTFALAVCWDLTMRSGLDWFWAGFRLVLDWAHVRDAAGLPAVPGGQCCSGASGTDQQLIPLNSLLKTA